jgi:hypothetical protein
MEPESLANTALNAVADDGTADRARHCEAQPGGVPRRIRTRQAKRSEEWSGEANTVVIDGSEFGGAQNPRCLRKRERAAAGGFS